MSRITITPPQPGDARSAAALNTLLVAIDTGLDAVNDDNVAAAGLDENAVDADAHSTYSSDWVRSSVGSYALTAAYAQVSLSGTALRLDGGGGGFTVPTGHVCIVKYSIQCANTSTPWNGLPAADVVDATLYRQLNGGGAVPELKSHSWMEADGVSVGSLGGAVKLPAGTYDWVELRAKYTATSGTLHHGLISGRIYKLPWV